MESGLRREQVFARVGGEEFAILYPEVSGEGARVLAERLCSRIAAERIVWAEETLSLTCSFGIAETSETVRTMTALYDEADRAMYRSKEGGRNRVSLRGREE